jgi:hypothetical protein
VLARLQQDGAHGLIPYTTRRCAGRWTGRASESWEHHRTGSSPVAQMPRRSGPLGDQRWCRSRWTRS